MTILCKLLKLCGGVEYHFRLSDASGSEIRAGVATFLTVGPLEIMSQRWFVSALPLTRMKSVKIAAKKPRKPKVAAPEPDPDFIELLQSQTADDYPANDPE